MRKQTGMAMAAGVIATIALPALAGPTVLRLTPPSNLFTHGNPNLPIVARFIPGQRFDLQATIAPDENQQIVEVEFLVDGEVVPGTVSLTPATVQNVPPGTMVATLRAYSLESEGTYELQVNARQDDDQRVSATGNFQILGKKAKAPKNVIVLIGDGLGIAHRTAARIMAHGVSQGKTNGHLAMDMPYTGLVLTHSLNTIVTDSSPGSSCYSSGNKGNNNQHGVFPDDTVDNFDNPRVELIGEYLAREKKRSLGIVTTSDVFDATPGAWGSHTSNRGAGTGICDQYFDDAEDTGLSVLLGGGRKWFLPASERGSARRDSTDYVLPDELADGWGVAKGQLDAERDLIGDFESAGWSYVANATELGSINGETDKLLGLFALSNMNVAVDKIDGRRGNPAVVNDYGFPDQPMLDEMTEKAIEVLSNNKKGFVLMVEAASIDKQAHNMDTERWLLDTLEFDRAVAVARRFADENKNTLVIVTADHECAGINIIGGSRVTDADLETRGQSGGGVGALRNPVVGTYDAAGFPQYVIAEDGYPETVDVDYRMLIGYAGNADRYEDWRKNVQPNRDSQQPFNNEPPLNTYPSGPLFQDVPGDFRVTGQVPGSSAVHTASDIPITAYGKKAANFVGVMDNTDVFFKILGIDVE